MSSPLARNSDPITSHIAADLIEPTRETKKNAVLNVLVEHHDMWLPGFLFTTPDVGGSEGLRRMRELRADGWDIKRTPKKIGTTWFYMLVLEGES